MGAGIALLGGRGITEGGVRIHVIAGASPSGAVPLLRLHTVFVNELKPSGRRAWGVCAQLTPPTPLGPQQSLIWLSGWLSWVSATPITSFGRGGVHIADLAKATSHREHLARVARERHGGAIPEFARLLKCVFGRPV